jgi:hypothetical protein
LTSGQATSPRQIKEKAFQLNYRKNLRLISNICRLKSHSWLVFSGAQISESIKAIAHRIHLGTSKSANARLHAAMKPARPAQPAQSSLGI